MIDAIDNNFYKLVISTATVNRKPCSSVIMLHVYCYNIHQLSATSKVVHVINLLLKKTANPHIIIQIK